ncbi:MAG TPA: TrmH family RNA methyltransferase [Anaerovoracaceae bacterium]|nr:TrmH family RNA methyltransferase [Anaerovoracaceae bacterium]
MDHGNGGDTRNIIDRYKGWMEDLIREDLKKRSFPYAVCMEQWQGDFNFGTLIRNANAFGAQEVFYIGKKNYDRRSTVGTHHYTSVKFLSDLEELKTLRQIYSNFIGVDNVPGSVEMNSFQWQPNSLLIFGEEGTGLTKEVIELCDHIVAITMYGSVRSLNAGVASGITMNDFVSKMK